jgi:hypothetical protein
MRPDESKASKVSCFRSEDPARIAHKFEMISCSERKHWHLLRLRGYFLLDKDFIKKFGKG